jgi:hypothetical protein
LLWMRLKRRSTKSAMTKSPAISWVRSTITERDVEKVTADGYLSEEDSIQFPSTERIPNPLDGYRVMFLAFLLRGLSLPAHEFLRGLLFFYGVQLHQLTPNSILHIACFVTLCESFLGIEPHFLLWRSIFCLRPSVTLSKNLSWAGPSYPCAQRRSILNFLWLLLSKARERSGSMSRTVRPILQTNMA